MRRDRRAVAFVGVLTLALGLVACGSDDDEDGGAASDAPATVTVTMTDFSFSASGPLTQGGQIRLRNTGDELHMMGVAKLKAGVTVQQLKDALATADPSSSDDPTTDLIEGEIGWPGAIVTPGREVVLSAANLPAGRYGLICFIPTEGGGPPHFAHGMVSELEVVSGTGEAPTPDATYTVTAGKPLEGPATLKAGERTIAISGVGDVAQLEPQLVKAQSSGQTAQEVTDAIQKAFSSFESESGPGKGAGKEAGKYIAFAGFDLGDASSVTFTYDFEPGTYYLAVGDSDGPEGDQVPVELIKLTVS